MKGFCQILRSIRKRGSKIKSHKRTIAFSRPSEPQSLGITDSVLREEHITQEVFKNVWNMILTHSGAREQLVQTGFCLKIHL